MPDGRSRKNARVPDRLQQLIDGDLKVEDLTDEEVMRGQLMDANGQFRGRPSKVIPREFHDAIKNELIGRSDRKLKEQLDAARQTILDIMNNPRQGGMVRLLAAQHIEARIVGPVPKDVQVKAEVRTWEDEVGGLLVDVGDDEPVTPVDTPAPVRRRVPPRKASQ